MDVSARTRKLARLLEDPKRRQRKLGAEQAGKLLLRLNALRAADSLGDFWPPNSGPERCHRLTQDLKGHFSMDLRQPYRLIFCAVGHDTEDFESEHEFWTATTAVEIVRIEDTHE